MTIGSQTSKNLYTGNGSQVVFDYTFRVFADTDLTVIRRAADGTETTLTLDVDYTVTGVDGPSGGDITLIGSQAASPPTSSEKLLVKRVLELTQAVDPEENGPLPAITVETALDRLTCFSQQIQEAVDRSLKVAQTSSVPDTVDPEQMATDAATATAAAASATASAAAAAAAVGAVRVTTADTTPAVLDTTLAVVAPLAKAVTSPGGNEGLSLSVAEMTGATASNAGTAGVFPAPAAGDQGKFACADGTWAYAGQAWTPAGAFTRTTDSTFTVADNATNQDVFRLGRPIRYRATAGTWRYGIVTGYSSGTVTVSGAPLTTSDDDEMQYGDMNRAVALAGETFYGLFSDAADSALFEHDKFRLFDWPFGRAYLVWFQVRPRVDDSGANQPRINMSVAGNAVSTSNSNAGLAVSDAAWTATTVDINTSNYLATRGDRIEVAVDANGSNKDASDLNLSAVFILE